jgi:NAD(P)H dehydrogenase (quinone)
VYSGEDKPAKIKAAYKLKQEGIMKYLMLYAHPNPSSFNHAIKECVESKLRKEKISFEVRDLYGMKFNPLLSAEDFSLMSKGRISPDIEKEQEYIRKSEILIFIYPIWWFAMPAIMKGYVDRVFSHGFAFRYTKEGPVGLLADKKAVILNTTGGPQDNYLSGGYDAALKKTMDIGIFEFCGLNIIRHKYFYAVPYVTAAERDGMLEEVKNFSW